MKKLLLAGVLVLAGKAQTAHQVTLLWGDPNNPAGTEYNVYRQASACPTAPPTTLVGFTKINPAPVSGLTFTDTPVAVGTAYCYVVTALVGSDESGPSPDAGATPLPFSPASLQVTVR